MPEPQSTTFFLLLIVVFGGLMWWLAVAKQTVFRILAACLAFIPAMMFGVAAVNKYYDYYQNWNAAISDLTGQSAQTAQLPSTDAGVGVKFGKLLGNAVDTAVAATDGITVRLSVPGRASHITRTVYVYLPPQYFQRSFRDYRFPAIELIHGFPGTPLDWITVVGVTSTLQGLISSGLAKPVVLVMPDANGGRAVSLQCLNQFHGPQDATYLAQDLPDYIAQVLRVRASRPGLGHRRLLGRRVLRRQPGPEVRRPVRLLRGAQRVFRAAGQSAGPQAGGPVWRERQAAPRQHPG